MAKRKPQTQAETASVGAGMTNGGAEAPNPVVIEQALRNLVTTSEVVHLDLDSLIVDETANVGRTVEGRYADAKFRETMESIRQVGVLQPVLYTLDAEGQPHLRVGFRRYEAVRRLRDMGDPAEDSRFATIPAIEINASNTDAFTLLKAALAENAFRKPLSVLDYVHIADSLVRSGMMQNQISLELYRSEGTVSKLLSIARAGLAEEVLMALHRGEMDLETAYELSKKPEEIREAVTKAVREQAEERALDEAQARQDGPKAKGRGKAPKGKGKSVHAAGTAAKGKGKGKSKLDRKIVKAATGKGKGKGELVLSAKRKRDAADVREFFVELAVDRRVKASVKRIAKTVLAWMNGKTTDARLRECF